MFQKIHSIEWSFCKRNTARVCGFSCFGVVSCFRFVPFVARVALFFPLKRFLSEFARYYGSPHLKLKGVLSVSFQGGALLFSVAGKTVIKMT